MSAPHPPKKEEGGGGCTQRGASSRQQNSTYSVRMRLVGLQLFVVRELDVDGAAPQLRSAAREVSDHGAGGSLVRHLEERLEHKQNPVAPKH